MRMIGAALLATTLLASNALAATTDSAAPLPAGKPAGVHNALLPHTTLALALGATVLIGGIILVTTQGGGEHSIVSTSTLH